MTSSLPIGAGEGATRSYCGVRKAFSRNRSFMRDAPSYWRQLSSLTSQMKDGKLSRLKISSAPEICVRVSFASQLTNELRDVKKLPRLTPLTIQNLLQFFLLSPSANHARVRRIMSMCEG